jgi:hypothetical protein
LLFCSQELSVVLQLPLLSWWFGICFMVFNATFNNISVISWWSVLLVEETHRPAASHLQTLSHNVVSSTPRNEQDSHSQLKSKKPFFFLIMINVSFVPLVNFCMNVTGGLVYSRFG